MLILVTGVSGSGKSEYAEQLCCHLAGDKAKYYIATMQPYGKEGKERIMRHHKLRQGKGFITIEQYRNIGLAVDKLHNTNEDKPVVLLECMSNLLANECFEDGGKPDDILEDCLRLYDGCSHLVIVTNEVFSDGCEYDVSTIDYIERLGRLNTQLASAADVLVEVVYSIPVVHKGDELCPILNH